MWPFGTGKFDEFMMMMAFGGVGLMSTLTQQHLKMWGASGFIKLLFVSLKQKVGWKKIRGS
jgi:ABC-type uncharacterized transport system involved in gliding motility auxiliary subunit